MIYSMTEVMMIHWFNASMTKGEAGWSGTISDWVQLIQFDRHGPTIYFVLNDKEDLGIEALLGCMPEL